MAWSSPRTWTNGEVLTSALMNQQVRDNSRHLKGPSFWYRTDNPQGVAADQWTTVAFPDAPYVNFENCVTRSPVGQGHSFSFNRPGIWKLGFSIAVAKEDPAVVISGIYNTTTGRIEGESDSQLRNDSGATSHILFRTMTAYAALGTGHFIVYQVYPTLPITLISFEYSITSCWGWWVRDL